MGQPFLWRFKLHCNQEETKREENCDSSNDNILLRKLTGEKTYKNVCNSTDCNAVGD